MTVEYDRDNLWKNKAPPALPSGPTVICRNTLIMLMAEKQANIIGKQPISQSSEGAIDLYPHIHGRLRCGGKAVEGGSSTAERRRYIHVIRVCSNFQAKSIGLFFICKCELCFTAFLASVSITLQY